MHVQRFERGQKDPEKCGKRGGLHAGRHEPCDERRRAFVRVRSPHVKRHGRDFEREPDEQQDHRQEDHDAGVDRRPGDAHAKFVELGRARDGVGERDAVEKECTRKRTEHEVLERRFGARLARALDAGQHVDAERHDLERDEDDEQVAGRPHQHHPGHREHHQRVVLAGRQVVALRGAGRQEDGQQANRADRHVEEDRVVIDDDHAETGDVPLPQEDRRDHGPDEPDDAEYALWHLVTGRAERFGQQDRARRQRDDEERSDGGDVGAHHRTLAAGTRRLALGT